MLRVLNAVRHVDFGIPLSLQQYKVLTSHYLSTLCLQFQVLICHIFKLFIYFIYLFIFADVSFQLLTPSVLINRLINAHKHLLALKISEYLGLNQVSDPLSYSNICFFFMRNILNILLIENEMPTHWKTPIQ